MTPPSPSDLKKNPNLSRQMPLNWKPHHLIWKTKTETTSATDKQMKYQTNKDDRSHIILDWKTGRKNMRGTISATRGSASARPTTRHWFHSRLLSLKVIAMMRMVSMPTMTMFYACEVRVGQTQRLLPLSRSLQCADLTCLCSLSGRCLQRCYT